jgi:hypothetical protein
MMMRPAVAFRIARLGLIMVVEHQHATTLIGPRQNIIRVAVRAMRESIEKVESTRNAVVAIR